MTPQRILLVDDNPADRLMAQTVIESEGYVVVPAEDAFQALDIISEGDEFHLYVIDLQMPKMSGIELLKRLQRVPKCAEVPKLIMSARNQPKDVKLAVQCGAKDYITKPIDPDVFASKLKILVGKATEWQEFEINQETFKPQASIQMPMSVKSISEVGGSLWSPLVLHENSMNRIDLFIPDLLELEQVNVRIQSVEEKDGGYIAKFVFTGLVESHQKQIRHFIQKAWSITQQEKSA